ncbi:hypothetical protein [Arthrobacter burdickii]|uniref:Membrane-associated oxidoreductase n=1 Tax=Arthrobacter burdickii TaxID=3035920 RepID=A0ABT8JXD2_9MICC|nr:hypothetical protein [Arthrobacter burdickii]MDN4609612.1 hypothetical protein [Arthrobacter burdickii]
MTANSVKIKDRLLKALASGEIINFAPGVSNDDVLSGDPSSWRVHRRLSATLIRDVLFTPEVSVDPQGLRIRGAFITGRIDFSYATLPCRIEFDRCSFEDAPIFDNASLIELSFNNSILPGLSVSSTTIKGGLYLEDALCEGGCWLSSLRTGTLSLYGASISNSDGEALDLDRAVVDGNAILNNLEGTGKVSARGLHVSGDLDLTGANLANTQGIALHLTEAVVENLTLDGVRVVGQIFAQGVRARNISLVGARIFNLIGDAISFDGAIIDRSVYLSHLNVIGQFRALGMVCGGQFALQGATLFASSGHALRLDRTTIDTLILDELLIPDGSLTLAFAIIQILRVDKDRPKVGLPSLASAEGLALGAIYGFLLRDRKTACEWLDTIGRVPDTGNQRKFVAQPWREFAKTYEQVGQPEDGRWLRYQAAKRTTKVAPATSKVVRKAYGWVVGYGYYPALVVPWMAALWLIVFIVCSIFSSAFTPTLPSATTTIVTDSNNQKEQIQTTGSTQRPLSYPAFTPALFALDAAVPAVSTGQSSAWRVTESIWISILLAAVKGFSWVLVALLLSGISGLLRKD